MIKIFKEDIDRTWGSHIKIHERIVKAIPREICFSDDEYKIACTCLDLFAIDLPAYNITDKESVSTTCTVILKLTGYYDNDGRIALLKKEEPEPIKDFVQYVVGFRTLPCAALLELDMMVRTNLKELEQLVERYEQEPEIRRWKMDGVRRNTHEAKVIHDFYERCLQEKDTIVRYLVNDMESRAISKAAQPDGFRDFTFLWYESYWDRPYRWWQDRSIEFFDYKCINTCRHRLNSVDVTQIPEFEEMYRQGKYNEFYEELARSQSTQSIFEEIFNYYIHHLPRVAKRKPIFDELQSFFEGGKWYGFTALALTQVEGMFSDMLQIINPGKPYSSLSKKVFALRPYYNYAERTLDYFEYQLPFLRNSFLHAGDIADRDFAVIALDLLYDIHYLMYVFIELKDPHVKLHRLLKQRSTEFITGLNSFRELFNIVADVRHRFEKNRTNEELVAVLTEWDLFVHEVLVPSGEIEHYLQYAMTNFDRDVQAFFSSVGRYTSGSTTPIDLGNMSVKDLNDNKTLIMQSLSAIKDYITDDFDDIYAVVFFVRHYKEFIKRPSADQQVWVEYIKNKYQDMLSKIIVIDKLLNDQATKNE